MKKWVGPGSRPLAVKDPIGNPLTVSGTTSFSPSLAISTFSSFQHSQVSKFENGSEDNESEGIHKKGSGRLGQ